MENFLLLILIITEIGFAVYQLAGKNTKKEWSIKRIAVNAAELVIYLIMLLLPGIDISFRFKGLVAVLVIRLFAAGVAYLIRRKSDKAASKICIVIGAILSITVFALSMLPAFLIKDYKGRPTTGPYEVAQAEAILIDESRVETFETDGSYREVPVHFYYPDGYDVSADGKIPLVFFSHGAFGYYQSNTSTYMELASNGYVVVSLDHPYHSFFTKDTDGKTITVDPTFMQTALNVGTGDETEAEVYDITSKWISLRIYDMNFAIDTVKAAAEGGDYGKAWYFTDDESREIIEKVVKYIDIEKIAVMGHSLGGATAVTVGRRDDISAVIDYDGTMLGEEIGIAGGALKINDEPYITPILCFDNEEHHFSRIEAKEEGYPYSNNIIMDNAAEGYETYFEGSEHMDYTDLPLIAPSLAKMLGAGDIDHEECTDRMNAITLQFFNYYLKGIGDFAVDEKY